MKYEFRTIEKKWKARWQQEKPFKAQNESEKEKFYVLDMFPYPSGVGLHVGHPLGYIASDIVARYKRAKGFNVLHPMGYDSFGLPAEQYAIQTGQHPAVTTAANINRYRQQLDDLGFSFDWDREVKTSDPAYYKWTQWIFLQIFNSWYNVKSDRAESIDGLIAEFEQNGNQQVVAVCSQETTFTAEQWKAMSEKEQQAVLLNYRLTYLSDSVVNWCPALGTVLANDEVKEGLSERGGYPVVQKKMRQWSMRITAYAERLLNDLDGLDWSESIKEIQRNWIGKSTGASIVFTIENTEHKIEVFSTRPDTIFGATFLVLAPEHELVKQLTRPGQQKEVEDYIAQTAKRSERERMADTKSVSGAFTGAYAIHPFTGKKMQIWIADYVLAGYGTGAVMAVPAGDQRDWNFAKQFGLGIVEIIEGMDAELGAMEAKKGKMKNSDFLNGMEVEEAMAKVIAELEARGIGAGKVNYRLRDAVFSRQRYWGEPIPMYFKDGMPYALKESELPLELPEVDKYLPTEDGEPPLARASNWKTAEGYQLETNTMPGWAGSSWYLYRYMDAANPNCAVSKEAAAYWKNVDLYIGGAEHATGHLLYVRFWTKLLHDLNVLPVQEPFQKMINQGMISSYPEFIQEIRLRDINNEYKDKAKVLHLDHRLELPIPAQTNDYEPVHIYLSEDVIYSTISVEVEGAKLSTKIDAKGRANTAYIKNSVLDPELWMSKEPHYKNAILIANKGYYKGGKWYDFDHNEITSGFPQFKTRRGEELEKMSKSKYNTSEPDIIIAQFGADTLRCYEMFMGPIEQHKPWDIQGIEGVHRFLKKFWRLFHNEEGWSVSQDEPSRDEYKILHTAIKKVGEDIERFSFNTVVSQLMIAVNGLEQLKCNKREVLEQLVVLLAPYAPFMCEELWEQLGYSEGISFAPFPIADEQYLKEDAHKYPVSFNGKMRFTLELSLSLSKEEIEQEVLTNEQAQKWLEGKQPKKVIVVPNKIVNIVV
jgi:leucyl-tRNA synthetase